MSVTPEPISAHTHALVMGLGRFGGGLGVTRHLLSEGVRVTLNDRASEEDLREPLGRLGTHENLRVALGEHDPALLEGVDQLIVNPAVPRPWEHAFIRAAQERGIRVTTEIEIAYRLLDPSRVIAITGSAGKSTTNAMTHHALRSVGVDAILAGNIGGSLLDRIDEISADTSVVLELSSAMIYWLWGRMGVDVPPPPRVACVTSYAPNHLDWHGDEAHYKSSKQELLRMLRSDASVVLPASLAEWSSLTNANTHIINDQDAIDGCLVPGAHNARNAACAVASASLLHPELERSALVDGVRAFSGLPHRLHRCHEQDGVIYIDDSKSTTPQATLLAVDAVESIASRERVHLIAGGYDKGNDLSPISEQAIGLAGLYCIGATGSSLCALAMGNAFDCNTLEAAMQRLRSRIKPRDLVLLSPGCASWDQFTNYEQRGERFAELAKQHRGAMT